MGQRSYLLPSTAGAPDTGVGHGTIRLRGRSAPAAAPAPYSSAGGPVGHGTIKLHSRPEEPAPVPAPAQAAAGPVSASAHGHGTIRLRG